MYFKYTSSAVKQICFHVCHRLAWRGLFIKCRQERKQIPHSLHWKVTYQISRLCSVILSWCAATCFLVSGTVVRFIHRVCIESFSKKILTESCLEHRRRQNDVTSLLLPKNIFCFNTQLIYIKKTYLSLIN